MSVWGKWEGLQFPFDEELYVAEGHFLAGAGGAKIFKGGGVAVLVELPQGFLAGFSCLNLLAGDDLRVDE